MVTIFMRYLLKTRKVFSLTSADGDGGIIKQEEFVMAIKVNINRVDEIRAMAQNEVAEAFLMLKIGQFS